MKRAKVTNIVQRKERNTGRVFWLRPKLMKIALTTDNTIPQPIARNPAINQEKRASHNN